MLLWMVQVGAAKVSEMAIEKDVGTEMERETGNDRMGMDLDEDLTGQGDGVGDGERERRYKVDQNKKEREKAGEKRFKVKEWWWMALDLGGQVR